MEFLGFYTVVVVSYFATPHRFRWALLLAASYYFYMSWKAEYVVLIIFSTLVDYWVGLLMDRSQVPRIRKLLLALSVCTNLGVLVAFKYWSFVGENITSALSSISLDLQVPELGFLLPVGISFYTFQSMSYTIDVYRRQTQPTKHLGVFALYVSFFPQLVAGPIERSGSLLPQFWQPKSFEYGRASAGLRLMLWGLFKKVVIADRVAVVVDSVYSSPQSFSGPILIFATFLFAVQIYCDFSAYSDIAIGAAKLMGYDLMTNFRRPYFASSIGEFWKRWHISLSTWFRDYVYIPMGGNRHGKLRQQVNILVVFGISGLWHGAAWTFVIWGLLHGVYLIAENLNLEWRPSSKTSPGHQESNTLSRLARTAWVFVLVLFGWVFFRAESLADVGFILRRCWSLDGFSWPTLWALGLPRFELVAALLCICVLFVVDYVQETKPSFLQPLWRLQSFRWATYLAGFYSIIMLGEFGGVDFIYFQF